jgi:thiol-disulfide isomerase/thioredoxin
MHAFRSTTSKSKIAGGVLAVALVAAACGGDDGDEAAPVDFDLGVYQGQDVLGGDEVAFGDVLGTGTPVILNFFAGQCPPCLVEMPWLEAAWQDHGDDVLLVGIDIGPFTGLGSNESGQTLLDQLEVTYPAGYAVDDTPVRGLEVTNMPFTVFFDGDGRIVDSHGGILTEQQIRDWFTRLAGS